MDNLTAGVPSTHNSSSCELGGTRIAAAMHNNNNAMHVSSPRSSDFKIRSKTDCCVCISEIIAMMRGCAATGCEFFKSSRQAKQNQNSSRERRPRWQVAREGKLFNRPACENLLRRHHTQETRPRQMSNRVKPHVCLQLQIQRTEFQFLRRPSLLDPADEEHESGCDTRAGVCSVVTTTDTSSLHQGSTCNPDFLGQRVTC